MEVEGELDFKLRRILKGHTEDVCIFYINKCDVTVMFVLKHLALCRFEQ